MKHIMLFESFSQTGYYYHGTDDKHEFNSTGNLVKGTFFSPNENEAKDYGKYVYRVKFKDTLNIWSTNSRENCKELLDIVGELYDTYYSDDDENYIINTVDKLHHNHDNWEPIENTAGALEYLSQNYDAIEISEGGVANVLLFHPVNEKLEEIKLL